MSGRFIPLDDLLNNTDTLNKTKIINPLYLESDNNFFQISHSNSFKEPELFEHLNDFHFSQNTLLNQTLNESNSIILETNKEYNYISNLDNDNSMMTDILSQEIDKIPIKDIYQYFKMILQIRNKYFLTGYGIFDQSSYHIYNTIQDNVLFHYEPSIYKSYVELVMKRSVPIIVNSEKISYTVISLKWFKANKKLIINYRNIIEKNGLIIKDDIIHTDDISHLIKNFLVSINLGQN